MKTSRAVRSSGGAPRCGSNRVWNRLDDLRGDAGVLSQRRPHVILRERHPDLAEETRQRADQGDVAPDKSGAEHQRVVAVILGASAHHREEAALEPLLDRGQLQLLARTAFERHVVEPDIGGVVRGDVVGALVDDAEAHILQHGHPFGERDRPAAAQDLEAGTCRLRLAIAINLYPERMLGGERLDNADVGNGGSRRVDFTIVHREGFAVTGEQGAAALRRMRQRQRLFQLVGPAPHDGFDGTVENSALDDRRFALVPADDEVDPHQRAFREKRIEGAHAPVEGPGEIVADLRPDLAVVAVARDVDQNRHEAVEAIAPGQNPHARALVKLKDR